ncbi:uncharacterized protein LOC121382952 [Gigantopelta aegis]|uniref:uncharacterized protein LOC121382952 n=1 Tax=Gigantopelta aegis TaxID=1735272 RepID=UPI001B88C96B|nr:uncharacterized protein LOC121382952 [Gigantopelta aegis]
MSSFQCICQELGVPIANEKTVGPVTTLTFLGLEIDTINRIVRIPANKIVALVSLLQKLITLKKVTLKDLQSLVGALSFFCKAIRAGRAFIRRFYDAMIGVKQSHHFIRINASLRADLLMWLTFLRNFNGQTYFTESTWTGNSVLNLFTDSTGSVELGCGAYFNGQWVYFQWPSHWRGSKIMKDITFLELVPVVLSMAIWGERLANCKILFHVDNMALVSILNKQTSKDKHVMNLIRPFVYYAMRNNIIFRAVHVAGSYNCIADAISRKQWQRFRLLAPNAHHQPQSIPDHFWESIYNLKLTDC